MKYILLLSLPGFALVAEEILSSRPVVISPRRIETETTLPVKGSKRAPKSDTTNAVAERTAEPAPPPEAGDETPMTIDEKNIVLKIAFRHGSIQLSRPIRKQLIALGLKPGQKIRISGFGEARVRNSGRLANLRARAVASFLNEAVGGIDATLQWSAKPYAAGDDGALIETVN